MKHFTHPVSMILLSAGSTSLFKSLNKLGYTNEAKDYVFKSKNYIYTTSDGKFYITDDIALAQREAPRYLSTYDRAKFLAFADSEELTLPSRDADKVGKKIRVVAKKDPTIQIITREQAGALIKTLQGGNITVNPVRVAIVNEAVNRTDGFSNFIKFSEEEVHSLFVKSSKREVNALLKCFKRRDTNIMLKQREKALAIFSQRLFGDSNIISINQGIEGIEAQLTGRSLVLPANVEIRVDHLRDGKSLLSFHKR